MVTRHGCKLACEIIHNHFGELVGKVCRCLTFRGSLTLPEIARFCEMPISQLRPCLLVLVQHNCVQGFKVEIEGTGLGASKVFTSYICIVENILHRMRFPKFLTLVREEFGEEAEALIEGLLEHGRLTLEQLIQRGAARSGKGESEVEKPLKETFASLVRSHFIERCPLPEPVLPPKPQAETKKTSRSVRSRSSALEDRNMQDMEDHRILMAAAPMDAERFLLPLSIDDVSKIDPDANTPSSDGKAGQKRKRDALQMDSKTLARIDEKEVLWRVNYEEFIRRLRHQLCVAQVRSRIDLGSGTILQAMLEAVRSSESMSRQKVSEPLSMDSILQAVRMTHEGRTMTMERIRLALQMMSAESVGFISRAGEMGGQYVINLYKIIKYAQGCEVEGVVLQRYGRESCRIFRLLTMKGLLEQKQISDMALVPLKEAREILYRLLKDEYLQLQDVAKAPDHAPSKTIYLWRVNYPVMLQNILDDMFRAASNIGQRLAHELEQEQEVLNHLKEYQHSKTLADGSGAHVTLTQSQHEKVKRIRRIATILETSLMKLDETIMLFNDF
eukprot:c23514_g1_i1 orf=77-1750(+)